MRVSITKRYYSVDDFPACDICGEIDDPEITVYFLAEGDDDLPYLSVCSDCPVEVFQDEQMIRFMGELVPFVEEKGETICSFCGEPPIKALILDDNNWIFICKDCYKSDETEREP